MNTDLQRRLASALERPFRFGMIGGDLTEHLRHSEAFGGVVEQNLAVNGGTESAAPQRTVGWRGCDLGTGGGLPGVVLAAMFPDSRWELIDVRARRVAEVERAVLALKMADRVDVHARTAQEYAHDDPHRGSHDVVVARSFGPPAFVAECASAVLAVGGMLVVSEPPTSTDERWVAQGLQAVGLGEPRFIVEDGFHFAVMRQLRQAPAELPRLPARNDRGWLVPNE